MKILDELKLQVRAACGADGLADYFHILLMEGQLKRVLEIVRVRPDALAGLLPVVANPEASMNVRFGAGAVFENQAGTPALRALVDRLGELSAHVDARVRADACHYLGLSADGEARRFLEIRLSDDNEEVCEIAAESLAAIAKASGSQGYNRSDPAPAAPERNRRDG